MGANYKIKQIKISWHRKTSIPYSATHILNSQVDTCIRRQKVLCWTFYKTNIYSYNALEFTNKQIKLKSVMYTKPWRGAFVYPAVISHHSRKKQGNSFTPNPATIIWDCCLSDLCYHFKQGYSIWTIRNKRI